MRFWFGKKESEQPPSRPNVIRKSISSYVRPTPALPVDRKTSEPAGDSPLGRSGSLITETRKTPTTGEFVPRARRGTLTTSDLEEFQRRSEDSSTSRRTSSASGPTRRRLSRAAEHRDDVTHPKIEALKAAQREAQERRAAQRKSFSPIEPPSELKDAQKLHRQNSSSKLRKYASHNLLRSRANSLTTSKSLENVNAAKAIRQVDVPEVPPMPERFAQGSARPIVPPERPVVKTAPEPTPEPTRTPSALRTCLFPHCCPSSISLLTVQQLSSQAPRPTRAPVHPTKVPARLRGVLVHPKRAPVRTTTVQVPLTRFLARLIRAPEPYHQVCPSPFRKYALLTD